MELKLNPSSLPTAVYISPSSLCDHFQRWKLHIQRISQKGQKNIVVHVVKEGETLTSISQLYGVPILDNCWLAAADKDAVDLDSVSGGQRRNIPSAIATGYAQLRHFEGTTSHEHQLPSAPPSLGFRSRQWNQIFTVLSPHRLPLAKTAGSFLVLIPLLAFCIKCIMGAFQNIISRKLRHRAENKSGVQQNRSNSMRWRSVLSDTTESEPDSNLFLEDEEPLHFEDTSRAYNKLEDDYHKFLSECGMSNWGYWRGGSPK